MRLQVGRLIAYRNWMTKQAEIDQLEEVLATMKKPLEGSPR